MEKKVHWHSQFGIIEIVEQTYRKNNKLWRPFIESAQVSPRGCSLPLQRILTDFGADLAFGQVSAKLQEHYGIEMPTSTIRKITEFHAEKMQIAQQEKDEVLDEAESNETDLKTSCCGTVVGQADGSMLPVVKTDESSRDKRKGKTVSWKEARLSLAHPKGSVSPQFRAVFNASVDEAGDSLRYCAMAVGFGENSHLHAVGDGAPWIAEQIQDKFGTQASYLIDFYHVCQYLAEAAKICSPHDTKIWMETQKRLLKNNEYQTVLFNLQTCFQSDKVQGDKEVVRKCHQYLSKRINYLDYKGALEKGLPIGSGEIESAHRYVIQKRLKLSGAWWTVENIKQMLALRVLRANGEWNNYWENLSKAA